MSSEQEILNLLYKYCWLVDQGKFDEMAEMFDECDIYYGDYLGISHDKEAFKKGFVEGDIVYAPDQTLLELVREALHPFCQGEMAPEEAAKAVAAKLRAYLAE